MDGKVITGATIRLSATSPFTGEATLSADGIECNCNNPYCAFHDLPRPSYNPYR